MKSVIDNAEELIPRLADLEKDARQLECDAGERARMLNKVSEYTEAYLNGLQTGRVYSKPATKAGDKSTLAIAEDPDTLDSVVDFLAQVVNGDGLSLGSDRFFGYIPSGGLYESALADFVAAIHRARQVVAFDPYRCA